MVFVGDQHYGIAVDDLQKLWQVHDGHETVMTRRTPSRSSGTNWMSKLLARSQQRQAQAATPRLGVQLIRREQSSPPPAMPTPPAPVVRRVDSSKSSTQMPGKTSAPKYMGPIKRFVADE